MEDDLVMLTSEARVVLGSVGDDDAIDDRLDRLVETAQEEGGPNGVTYRVRIVARRLLRVLRTKNNTPIAFYYGVIDLPSGPRRRIALQPVVGWQESFGGQPVQPVPREDVASVLDEIKADFERFATTIANAPGL